MNRGSKEDKVFGPSDFFPGLKHFYGNSKNSGGVPGDDRKIKSTQTVEEQIAAMEMWTTMYHAQAIGNAQREGSLVN